MKAKKPAASRGLLDFDPGNFLLFHAVASAVPSAQEGLTSVFGMGTGVTPPLWSPGSSNFQDRAQPSTSGSECKLESHAEREAAQLDLPPLDDVHVADVVGGSQGEARGRPRVRPVGSALRIPSDELRNAGRPRASLRFVIRRRRLSEGQTAASRPDVLWQSPDVLRRAERIAGGIGERADVDAPAEEAIRVAIVVGILRVEDRNIGGGRTGVVVVV